MNTSQDLDAALQASQEKPIVIFKHSNSCPFSARAQVQIANAKHDIDIYGIVIQYAKDLSEEIAERLDVKHASPQAIVVHRGEAVDHYWRSDIQEDSLKEQVRKLGEQA
ncbi:bacillithiol system redox-active protein YtxJ [Lewinella sp. JB7]|uniref:bacillithiol system redox-active protein YtxJ n=1 Tax=Lewinella sp. JB7 TaxID=2962887 RepID=UPI0020CA026F|nr:bacillithiol system redox-active protein YtxJ [Lewinella sp. JB7]MCP9236269.1 bacillithiol system redox-active protein YtxJ [Lewinella sp. JB7]